MSTCASLPTNPLSRLPPHCDRHISSLYGFVACRTEVDQVRDPLVTAHRAF